MVKNVSSLFSSTKRTTPTLDLKPELTEPNSDDFNLFYKPETKPLPAGLEIFAKSLDTFVNDGAVDAYVVHEKKKKKKGEAEATKEFLLNQEKEVEANKLGFNKQVNSGKIPKEANPYFIDKYKELELNAKADQFKVRVYKEYANKQVAENPNSDAFQKFYKNELKLFIGENQLGSYDAIELEKGFFKKTSAMKAEIFGNHVKSQMAKIGEQYKTNFTNNIQGKFDSTKTFEQVGADVSTYIQDAVKNGLSKETAKKYLLETLMDYAEKTGDFEYAEKVLRELPKHIDLSGTGAKFSDIKGLKDDFYQIKEKLEDRKDQELKDDNTRDKAIREKEYSEAFNIADNHLTLTDAMASSEWKNYSNYKKDQIKKVYAGQTVGFSTDQDPNIDSQINGKLAENDTTEEAMNLLTDSIPIITQTYFNKKKQEILSFKVSGKDGLLAIKEYKAAETRINQLLKIQNDAAKGQSIKIGIDPMLAEKFKYKMIDWLADHPTNFSERPIYSNSKRRQDFEKFISDELKKEEAAIVFYVQRKHITIDGQETEKADLNKIKGNKDSKITFEKEEGKAELQVDISNVEIIPSNLIHSHAINEYKKKNPNAITQSDYNKIQSDPDYKVDLETVTIIPKDLKHSNLINQYKKKNPNAITQQTYERIKKKQLKFNKKDGVDEGVIKDKKKAKNK